MELSEDKDEFEQLASSINAFIDTLQNPAPSPHSNLNGLDSLLERSTSEQ